MISVLTLGTTMKTDEFMNAKNLLITVQMGKGKGDLAWQHAQLFRTELDYSNKYSDAYQFKWIVHLKKGFTIRPNPAELNDLKIDIAYDINKDCYVRKTSDGEDVIPDWSSLTLANDNIFIKKEFDWNMIYLARKESAKKGYLFWELDLKQQDVSVKSIELFVTSRSFETGLVIWRIKSDKNNVLQPTPGKICLKSSHHDL